MIDESSTHGCNIRECCQRFIDPGGIPYPWIMRKLQAKSLRGSHLNCASFIYNASAFWQKLEILNISYVQKTAKGLKGPWIPAIWRFGSCSWRHVQPSNPLVFPWFLKRHGGTLAMLGESGSGSGRNGWLHALQNSDIMFLNVYIIGDCLVYHWRLVSVGYIMLNTSNYLL